LQFRATFKEESSSLPAFRIKPQHTDSSFTPQERKISRDPQSGKLIKKRNGKLRNQDTLKSKV
jgi:hypothetical protein